MTIIFDVASGADSGISLALTLVTVIGGDAIAQYLRMIPAAAS
jgi:hypothetical protein